MKKRGVIIAGSLLLLLAVVGITAERVGNIGIRRVKPTDRVLVMNIISPLVAGVDGVVRWPSTPILTGHSLVFSLRTASSTVLIGKAEAVANQATISIPCMQDEFGGSIVASDATSGEIFGIADVTLLPPGPDCIY